MTDLNLLYGSEDNLMSDQMGTKEGGGMYSSQLSGQQLHKMALQPSMEQEEKQQMQQQQMQPLQLKPLQKDEGNFRRRTTEYTFMDRMNMKKTEVIKLALFSLVIVLGISIDRMITHYISKYIGDNVLTDFQELLLRISYPIAIFLLLWIFKAI